MAIDKKAGTTILPEETATAEDAIEYGSNSVYYFNSDWSTLPIGATFGWPYNEKGYSISLNTFYPQLISQTSMEPFKCGFEYAWRIDAREIIEGFDSGTGNHGLWGWPEAEKSMIRKFIWGESPTGLESPSGDDVLPTFRWDNLWCAESEYDFQISLSDDIEFNEWYANATKKEKKKETMQD